MAVATDLKLPSHVSGAAEPEVEAASRSGGMTHTTLRRNMLVPHRSSSLCTVVPCIWACAACMPVGPMCGLEWCHRGVVSKAGGATLPEKL